MIFDAGKQRYGGNVFAYGYNGTTAAKNLAVGDSFYIPVKIGGTRSEYPFVVVHKGKPSSLYDDSCTGIWIMSANLFPITATFDTADYSTSQVATKMETIFQVLDSSIRDWTKAVKIPYTHYVSGTGEVVESGENGFACNAFPLAVDEMGFTTISAAHDGTKLDYFETVTNTQPQAIGTLNGEATPWYTRTAHMTAGGTMVGYRITISGGCVGNANTAFHLRPALIIDENYPIRQTWLHA